jgi:hypothetical protein
MFRGYTFTPSALAALERGFNKHMGFAGIHTPHQGIYGITTVTFKGGKGTKKTFLIIPIFLTLLLK